MTAEDPLGNIESRIVDNDAGLLPESQSGSMRDVIESYCTYAAGELDDPVYGMDIGTGFVFLSGFEATSEAFRELLDAGVLAGRDADDWGTAAPIRVVMGQQTDRHTKQVLSDLVRGNLGGYDSEAADVLGELLAEDLLEVRVVDSERFHAKIYSFYLTGSPYPDDTWNGSANFSGSGLSGNVELSLPVQTTFDSRRRLRSWFDSLWDRATADLDVLEILDDVRESDSVYYSPKTFFAAVVAALDKEYLLEDAPGASTDQLLDFQDFSYRIVMSRLETFGGYVLANSVGTGKTYVACQVAKTYLRSRRVGPETDGRVLAVVPSAVLDDWRETLAQFGIADEVDVASMGQFQKTHRSESDGSVPEFDERPYAESYRLVVVDEAHNYRNNSNRRNNLERVVRSNPGARVLLLSATPINLSPDDLFRLVDLFRNGRRQDRFQKHDLHRHYVETRARFRALDDYENFDQELLEDIREIERALSLKLTWRIVANEYGDDLRAIAGDDVSYYEPSVEEVSYSYPATYRRHVFDEIVPFLEKLHYESAKLGGESGYDPDVNVVFFRKWRLYKQLESSVAAFQEGLRNLYDRTRLYRATLRNRRAVAGESPADLVDDLPPDRVQTLLGGDPERLDRLTAAFDRADEETRRAILERMGDDVTEISRMRERVESHAGSAESVPRRDDTKAARFVELIAEATARDQPVVVFSEFVSTVEYLYDVLDAELPEVDVGLIHGRRDQSKEAFVESFQSGEFDVAVTTELLAEGVNLPRADVVVNYDLPYNPTALVQRTGRALRITNPKQVHVRNFTPDDAVDRELDLYETLDARLENIVQIAGLDFVVWMMDDERVETMRSQERDEYLEHLQEYKRSLGGDDPGGSLDSELPARDRIDVVLEDAIDEYDVDADLVERVPTPSTKPIHTVLEADGDPGLGVVGAVGETASVWSDFQPSVTSADGRRELDAGEWRRIEELAAGREESLVREQTSQGNLGSSGAVHETVREARERLTDRDMRSTLTDLLTGLENSAFRPAEEREIATACELILDYPSMVRNVDDQVRARDQWDTLEQLARRSETSAGDEGVPVTPLAVAKYVRDP